MKKIFKMLHIEEITFFEVFEAQFPPRQPLQGNVIGSHYILIVGWAPSYHIGIAISRN